MGTDCLQNTPVYLPGTSFAAEMGPSVSDMAQQKRPGLHCRMDPGTRRPRMRSRSSMLGIEGFVVQFEQARHQGRPN